MKRKLAALGALAVVFAVSAFSCGTVESTEESVVLSVDKGTVASTEAAEGETEATTETTTGKEKKETTTKAGSEESATEADDAETTTKASEQETTQAQEQNNDNNNNNNNNNQPEQPVQNTEQPQPANTEPPVQQTEPPRNETVTFSLDTLLSDASAITPKLGNLGYSGRSPACTNNGSDIMEYEFENIKLQCYFEGSVEKICHIQITGGDYATDKGIKVGSSRADVEAAYGAGQEFGTMVIYASGEKEMDITYSGDTVSAIDFNAVV